jgi:hypothetical protein
VFPRDMVCLRNITLDILHKEDTEDNNNNNNNDIYERNLSITFMNLVFKLILYPFIGSR